MFVYFRYREKRAAKKENDYFKNGPKSKLWGL